jgi:hypothetical protein
MEGAKATGSTLNGFELADIKCGLGRHPRAHIISPGARSSQD